MSVYTMSLYPGETLFREVVIKDEGGDAVDVSGTAMRVNVSPALDAGDFTVALGDETNSIELRADGSYTQYWPEGQHHVQIWLDWGELEDIEDEIIFEGVIAVRKKINDV